MDASLIYGVIPLDHVFGAWVDRQHGWGARQRVRTFRYALDEMLSGRPNPAPTLTRKYANKDALAHLLLRHAAESATYCRTTERG